MADLLSLLTAPFLFAEDAEDDSDGLLSRLGDLLPMMAMLGALKPNMELSQGTLPSLAASGMQGQAAPNITSGNPKAYFDHLLSSGVSPHLALGMTARGMVESNVMPGLQEKRPLIRGSRGGIGIHQWTGPRRKAYESFLGGRTPTTALEAQFTLSEPEFKAINRQYQSPEQAGVSLVDSYSRPKHRKAAKAATLQAIKKFKKLYGYTW